MRMLDSEIVICGTAEQVWTVLTDCRRYREWNPFICEASGDIRPGARLTVRIHPPDARAMTFRPTLVEVSPGRELRWVGHFLLPGLFDGEHAFRIEATSNGVLFRQSEQFRGLLVPVIPTAIYERTQRGFEAMNRALKERVETF